MYWENSKPIWLIKPWEIRLEPQQMISQKSHFHEYLLQERPVKWNVSVSKQHSAIIHRSELWNPLQEDTIQMWPLRMHVLFMRFHVIHHRWSCGILKARFVEFKFVVLHITCPRRAAQWVALVNWSVLCFLVVCTVIPSGSRRSKFLWVAQFGPTFEFL